MTNLADELERLANAVTNAPTGPDRVNEWGRLSALVRGNLPRILSALRKPASLTGEGEPVAQDAKDAEITRLRADITGLEDGNMTFLCDQLDKAKAENAAQAVELERMREALGMIAEGSAPPDPHGHYLAHRRAVDAARQALKAG